jgi:hydrogenase 3 maturation protease
MIGRGGALAIGIGNPLRGDDAAGLEVAGNLARSGVCPVILAGDTPENHLDIVRKARPSRVLLIDAAHLGTTPGDAAIVRMGNGATFAPGSLPSTHRPSLSVLTTYIERELGAEVWLLGIQPRTLEPGRRMSAEVAAAIGSAADLARSWIQSLPATKEA